MLIASLLMLTFPSDTIEWLARQISLLNLFADAVPQRKHLDDGPYSEINLLKVNQE